MIAINKLFKPYDTLLPQKYLTSEINLPAQFLHTKDTDFMVVADPTENIVYISPQVPSAKEELIKSRLEYIMAVADGLTLVDASCEQITAVYYYSTFKVGWSDNIITDYPQRGPTMHVVFYMHEGKYIPVRVGQMPAYKLGILNQATNLIHGGTPYTFTKRAIATFLEMQIGELSTAGMLSDVATDMRPRLEPLLQKNQYEELPNLFKKGVEFYKKAQEKQNEKKDTTYYLSEILSKGVPTVEKITPVEIDLPLFYADGVMHINIHPLKHLQVEVKLGTRAANAGYFDDDFENHSFSINYVAF